MTANLETARWWVSRALFIALCYLAAACTASLIEWRLEPAPVAKTTITNTTVTVTTGNRGGGSGLANLDNFQYLLSTTTPLNDTVVANATTPAGPNVTARGRHGAVAVTQAPVPRGEVPKLKGTLAGSGHALAVLETGNETRILGAGEEINGFKVLAVTDYEARLRDPQGQEFNLTLGLATASGIAATPPPPLAVVATPTPGASATPGGGPLTVRELREMLDHAGDYAATMNVHAVRRGDEVAGYQVNYTSDNNPFARLGLQNGDILVSFQNKPLKGPEDLSWAYSELRNSTSLSFRVERAGKVVPLNVDLSE